MGAFAPSLPVGSLNVALSNYAKTYRPFGLVGDMIAPRVPVQRQSFQYVVFDKSNLRLDRQTLRAPGDIPQSDRMNYGVAPYFCNSHALRTKVPYEQEQYALGLGFSEKQAATTRMMDKLNLDRENYIASLVTNAANVPNNLALSGGSMFDSYLTGSSASQPTEVIEAAKSIIRQEGVEANLAILGDPVVTALMNNPVIVERFKYTAGGAITMDQISQVLGIKCVRASAVALNQNNVASFLWGTNVVLTYTQPATSMDDLSALKTFDWAGARDTVGGYGVLEFPDPNLDAKADIISVDWNWDIRITAPETLYLISNCVNAPVMTANPVPLAG
jgi:hypothetical protein